MRYLNIRLGGGVSNLPQNMMLNRWAMALQSRGYQLNRRKAKFLSVLGLGAAPIRRVTLL